MKNLAAAKEEINKSKILAENEEKPDHYTCERKAIEDWFQQTRDQHADDRNLQFKSPKTNATLAHVHLTPNINLKISIREYLEKKAAERAKEFQLAVDKGDAEAQRNLG